MNSEFHFPEVGAFAGELLRPILGSPFYTHASHTQRHIRMANPVLSLLNHPPRQTGESLDPHQSLKKFAELDCR